MTDQAAQNREDLKKIQTALALGYLSYDEAQQEAAPIIARMNERAREIAKKHGRTHHDFTFKEIMR